MFRSELFCAQREKDLEKRANWVELCNVCSSEKVGDVIWIVEDHLPNLPSALGTQFEAEFHWDGLWLYAGLAHVDM